MGWDSFNKIKLYGFIWHSVIYEWLNVDTYVDTHGMTDHHLVIFYASLFLHFKCMELHICISVLCEKKYVIFSMIVNWI